MTEHTVRSWCHLYGPMMEGRKTHDLRKDDRNYKVGDTLKLEEYDITKGAYTGRWCRMKITYITGRGESQNPCAVSSAVLPPEYVILSVSRI